MDKQAKAPQSELKADSAREFEAKLDKRAAKAAKELEGHVHINRPTSENVPMQVLGEAFKKSARRKVN